MTTRHEIADRLTTDLRHATGGGTVEYAPANREYVIWPWGEPYTTARDVRRAIRRYEREAGRLMGEPE